MPLAQSQSGKKNYGPTIWLEYTIFSGLGRWIKVAIYQ
jgi:hypothetical protein